MAPRKLSDSDKENIVELYRQPGQTTSTLAEQYGVSNSTISRILKLSMPAEDYKALVSQKRMGGGADKSGDKQAIATPQKKKGRSRKSSAPDKSSTAESGTSDSSASENAIASSPLTPESQPANSEPEAASERTSVAPPKLKTAAEKEESTKATPKKSSTRRRRRGSAAAETDEQLPLLSADEEKPVSAVIEDEETEEDEDDLLGLDETLSDDFGDDDDDLDEDDLEDDDSEDDITPKPKLQSKTDIRIMPLGEAVLPKPCYLVVDMRAELITRPLIEFADLGQVPSEEERAKTLPVFDNHRVARRFSRNKQRVIKVPDGSLITRTSPYLAAKGITRLLVDGQVFDLASTDH